MPLPPLYGHDGLRNRLAGAVASGRLPQALLFSGPAGVGKQRLALWLAQLLVCERGPARAVGARTLEPCGECQACRLTLTLSHPDVHWFVPIELAKKGADQDKQVELAADALAEAMAARREAPLSPQPPGLAAHGVASVRLMLRRLALKPAMGQRTVLIIGDAERLIPQPGAEAAANALLKALEEPGPDTVVVLTAAEPAALLPTIVSLVVRVRLPQLPDSIVAAFAQRELGKDDQHDIAQRVSDAEGCIGKLLAGESGGVARAPEQALVRAFRGGRAT